MSKNKLLYDVVTDFKFGDVITLVSQNDPITLVGFIFICKTDHEHRSMFEWVFLNPHNNTIFKINEKELKGWEVKDRTWGYIDQSNTDHVIYNRKYSEAKNKGHDLYEIECCLCGHEDKIRTENKEVQLEIFLNDGWRDIISNYFGVTGHVCRDCSHIEAEGTD